MPTAGKKVVDEFCVHLSAAGEVEDAQTRQAIEHAIGALPPITTAAPNVAEVNVRTGRASLLSYPDFFDSPFPVLAASWVFQPGATAPSWHRTYAVIKAHPLHYGLIDLVPERIQAREFAEWSMACQVVGAGGESPRSGHYDLLASRLSAAVRTHSAARLLLSHFWTEGRESVAPALLKHGSAVNRDRHAARPDTSTSD